MKEKFLRIPTSLRRQILIRAGGCGLGMAMLLMLVACGGSWKLLLPCVILSIVCLESAASLFDRCDGKRYVVITGICTEIEKTPFRRRIKAVYLRSNPHTLRVVCVGNQRSLNIGDTIAVYVSDNTAVYDVDGCKVICTYLALEKITPQGLTNAPSHDIMQ